MQQIHGFLYKTARSVQGLYPSGGTYSLVLPPSYCIIGKWVDDCARALKLIFISFQTIEKFAGSDVASLLSNIVNLFKTFSANNKGRQKCWSVE